MSEIDVRGVWSGRSTTYPKIGAVGMIMGKFSSAADGYTREGLDLSPENTNEISQP